MRFLTYFSFHFIFDTCYNLPKPTGIGLQRNFRFRIGLSITLVTIARSEYIAASEILDKKINWSSLRSHYHVFSLHNNYSNTIYYRLSSILFSGRISAPIFSSKRHGRWRTLRAGRRRKLRQWCRPVPCPSFSNCSIRLIWTSANRLSGR